MPTKHKLLSLKAVREVTSLSKTTVYRLIRAGKFPKSKRITVGRVAWFECDVMKWIESGATS